MSKFETNPKSKKQFVACRTHDLANDFAKSVLTSKERKAYASAIRKGKKLLRPLRDPWA